LETFGRVIIEAMEYGIPVIANKIGSIGDIIEHDKTGYLLQKNSPEEIINHIITLNEEDVYIRMRIESRKLFVNKYTYSSYRKSFLDIIYSGKYNRCGLSV
jgi:glycosyltransferase involved in cell wall biosynthesis